MREGAMTKMDKASAFSRRSVLKGAGAYVVSMGMPVEIGRAHV